MSLRMFWRLNRPSSRPARICDPSLNPTVIYTWRMSICAPACVPPALHPTTAKLSWQLLGLLICGAKPKWIPRFKPPSLPRASNVANAGSNPVRTLEFAGPLLLPFVNTQKAFTFPENWNAQPFDICIVRPCALAVAETPSAKPNNNSARRFIRDSLLGSLHAAILPLVPSRRQYDCPRQVQPSGKVLAPVLLVWLLTYSCVNKQGESGAHLLESELLRAALRHRADRTRPRQRPLGTPRSREVTDSPQEWPPMTACELGPSPPRG